MPQSLNLGRRGFLGVCLATMSPSISASGLGPSRGNAQSAGPPSPTLQSSAGVYQRLGLRPLINAAGILTNLGGSLILPEVRQAMDEASRHYVSLLDLQQAAGARIAQVVGVEAAIVTSGAAAALLVGTAACVTKGDPERVRRIPDISGMPSEVIVQTSHRHNFDHAIRSAGCRFIEVETRADLERAIGPNTAMMHFLAFAEHKGQIGAAEWIAVAKARGIPNVVDAAAELPPSSNLRRFCDQGFDLVAFSGGKALRGPQCSGLLLGRRDLVEAASLNNAPHSDSIGRGCKVGKEEIIGLLTAVELYMRRDHEADRRRWTAIIDKWDDALETVPQLTLKRQGPENAGREVPYLSLDWSDAEKGLTREAYVKRLREGEPRIELWPTRDRGLCVTPFMLDPGEEIIVGRRLVEAFTS